jgi:glycosyltransferase involved in cell wall biosynthesis
VATRRGSQEVSGAKDALRIAIVAPPWYPLPPSGYGGTELVVHLLQTELRRMGHQVTTFGAAGSGPGVTTLADASWSHDLGGPDERARQATYLARVYGSLAGERFDVLHDHSGYEGVVVALHSGIAPVVVHTIHGELLEPMCSFYKEVMGEVRLCAISLSQAASAPVLKLAGIVHNAVELPATPPNPAHERYLIEVARITPDKGQHLAIQVARRTGRKLILAGKVERSGEGERYFEEKVEPFLGPTVEYYPNVAGQQKTRLISRAAAGIFPLQWAEPFGLAMVECMVAGTPVVALRFGSTAELIEHGVTGFLAEDVDGLVAATNRIDEIDRVRCAEVARERFGPHHMAERYLSVYRRGTVELEPFPADGSTGEEQVSLRQAVPRR